MGLLSALCQNGQEFVRSRTGSLCKPEKDNHKQSKCGCSLGFPDASFVVLAIEWQLTTLAQCCNVTLRVQRPTPGHLVTEQPGEKENSRSCTLVLP